MTRIELGKAIYETSNIKGEFLLRSGEIASEYFDKYLFESKPKILAEIAIQMSLLVGDGFDLLAGLEMGGIPIATALSLKTGKGVIFVRKEAKKYGTCKLAEGDDVKGKRVAIIEDVVTSGGAVIEAVEALRVRGAIVENVYCVIDREGTGRKNIEALDLKFYPLFSKSELEDYARVK